MAVRFKSPVWVGAITAISLALSYLSASHPSMVYITPMWAHSIAETLQKRWQAWSSHAALVIDMQHRLNKQGKENAILRESLRRLQATVQSNEADWQSSKSYKRFSLAKALEIKRGSLRHHAVVRAGYGHGLHKGSLVLRNGVLVGKITKIFSNQHALVQLLTDTASATKVYIEDKDVSGVMVGRGGYELHLLYVPTDKAVRVGDKVRYLSEDVSDAHGVLIGTVVEVTKRRRDFQSIKVKAATNMDYSVWLTLV